MLATFYLRQIDMLQKIPPTAQFSVISPERQRDGPTDLACSTAGRHQVEQSEEAKVAATADDGAAADSPVLKCML